MWVGRSESLCRCNEGLRKAERKRLEKCCGLYVKKMSWVSERRRVDDEVVEHGGVPERSSQAECEMQRWGPRARLMSETGGRACRPSSPGEWTEVRVTGVCAASVGCAGAALWARTTGTRSNDWTSHVHQLCRSRKVQGPHTKMSAT